MKDLTVLVADDDEDVRNVVVAYMDRFGYTEKNGYRVKFIDCVSGDDAWNAIKDVGVDLAFLDDRMYGTSGSEVARRTREGYDGRNADTKTPIIMISGTSRSGDIRADVDDLGKPIDSQKMRDMVKKYLGDPNKVEV